jgi:nitroimidazol reductase NimA-like FMN-containing flavoprotein (pyridoxamine 5'-phosphate oxidase superfamily)
VLYQADGPDSLATCQQPWEQGRPKKPGETGQQKCSHANRLLKIFVRNPTPETTTPPNAAQNGVISCSPAAVADLVRDNRRVSDSYPQTPRTSATREAHRMSYDRETVHTVLDEAVICHVGFVAEGRPVVLPHLHVRLGEVLYLHGSTGARVMRTARGDGLAVCVTVTLVDGLVLARSAFNHSVNYRSVVVHGTAVLVEDPQEKSTALAALVEAVVPGRTGGTRPPSRSELAATAVLRLDLREVSVKVRTGPPEDEPEDLGLPYWAGVLPLVTNAGTPLPSLDLADGVDLPEHVTAWKRPRTS